MYEEHFALRPRPFGDSPGGSNDVALPSRDIVRHRLRYSLEQGGGPALLVGPTGSGKTLSARALGTDLQATRIVHLTFPVLPADDLLEWLADELGPAPSVDGRTGWSRPIQRIQQGLARSAGQGNRPLLIVDEAHLIEDSRTFEVLRLLLNFASLGPPDLSLLIVGAPETTARLPASLLDRLAAQCWLGALTLTETATYVLGRLRVAGATRPLFDPPSLSEIHAATDGLPRRLNRLADLALLIAYAEDRTCVDASHVVAAARESCSDLLAA